MAPGTQQVLPKCLLNDCFHDSNLDDTDQASHCLRGGGAGPEGLRKKQRCAPRLGRKGGSTAAVPQGTPYLTLQGVSFLGPGHFQVLRQHRELVAPCPVVVVTG